MSDEILENTLELRKALSNLGIEWRNGSVHKPEYITDFKVNGFLGAAVEKPDGKFEFMMDYGKLLTGDQVTEIIKKLSDIYKTSDYKTEELRKYLLNSLDKIEWQGDYFELNGFLYEAVKMPSGKIELYCFCPCCGSKIIMK